MHRLAAAQPRTFLLALGLVVGAARSAHAGEDPYQWAAPPAAAQLHGDDAAIPSGKGAIFVPSLTRSEAEPDVLIVDRDRVRRAPTGRRIVVEPGAYVVLVGTGRPDQRVGVEVVVEAGSTTLAQVAWGGLRVEAVSKRLKPRPDVYQLVRVATGERVELPIELRQDNQPHPETWLLEPGLYRIQEDGSGGVDAPVFTTVHVPAGGLVHHRLFVDRAGGIQGGGVIPGSVYQDLSRDASPFTRTLVMGVDGSGTQTRNIAGFPDLTALQGSAFVDFDVGYTDDRSAVRAGIDLEYGMLLLQPATGEPLPLVKSRDRLHAHAAYTFRLNEGVGLYARGEGLTQITDTFGIATEDSVIAFRETNGTVRDLTVDAPNTYKIADAFQPLMLAAGTGAEVRLSTTRELELLVRGGLGYRHMRFGGAYVPTDNADTPAVEYTQLRDYSRPGLEAGAVATIRLTGFANWTTQLDLFTAFDGAGGLFATWDNTLAVRLSRSISVNYALNAARMPWVTDRLQLRQGAFVRFSLNVL